MKPQKTRMLLVSIGIMVLFAVLLGQLARLTMLEHDDALDKAQSKSTKTITLTGKRGTIYDANMTPVAYDRVSYNVQFYRDPSRNSAADRAAYTQTILDVIRIVESNGKATINDFWLAKDEDGVWRFHTGAASDSADATRKRQWRANFYEVNTPEEELFGRLCEKYYVPGDLSDEDKVKVLAIWQEQRMNNYLPTPVTVAYDVGFETVAEIEAASNDLMGISIAESSERVYPKKYSASHVIGYISRISGTSAMEDYLEKGYTRDALVGSSGIEASMEDQLSPYLSYRQGSQVVELNRSGKVIRQISYEAPVDGNSVVLTLNMDLQRVAESALVYTIRTIHDTQTSMMDNEIWLTTNAETLAKYEAEGREVQLAETGALIAMDPNTGRILAMASYPNFDLSIFEGEVDKDTYNDLLENPYFPLYNRAISSRDTPGSIFKLVTALGGLMEGVITPETRITDEGEFMGTDISKHPKCWVSNANRWTHAQQTVVEGLKNSCNYFFYKVGQGLGITNIVKWAAQLGLTSRTGIELNGETTSFVGDQSKLYDADRAIANQYTSKPLYAYYSIEAAILKIGQDRHIEYDQDRIERVAKSLMDITVTYGRKTEWLGPIRAILMHELNLPSEYISSNLLVNEFYYCIQDLQWTSNETIMTAIGQSITQVTPIAVARYVAAVANGGTVYNAQLVDKVISPTGEVILQKDPVVANHIDGAEEYLAVIRKGMEEVTSTENDGTAAKQFSNARYPIAAKTGTAERTDIDLENNSWLVTYAPHEDPQIVVVVYIQNGYAGAQSAPAAIQVIEAYLDMLAEQEVTTFAEPETLAD